jgi:choline-sulfatase
MKSRPNILVIMSDEHDPAVTGCYGHPLVHTPHLDRLATEAAVFDYAYCNSPLCVPSRMSFLTGRYCHDINVWDLGSPLASEIPTLAHYMEAGGYDSNVCGRTHIIGDNRHHGFGRRLFDDRDLWRKPNHIPRTPEWRRGDASHVTSCGPGEGRWVEYDETVTDLTCRFLSTRARENKQEGSERPWLLVSGYMNPHFPLTCPPEYYDLYRDKDIPLPGLGGETLETQHPVIRHLRWALRNDKPISEEIQRSAQISYYGLVTFLDHQIGQILKTLENTGQDRDTIVIYCSDHGEMGGQHGFWQKMSFYEPSVRVPLIMRVPGASASRVAANTSLVDIAPTLLDAGGITPPKNWPGDSLLTIAARPDDFKSRPVFSEYHGQGMVQGGFMLKRGNLKYCYYVGSHPPQLFDVKRDPQEFNDLARDPDFADIIKEFETNLRGILDPEAVDAAARCNQELSGVDRTKSAKYGFKS